MRETAKSAGTARDRIVRRLATAFAVSVVAQAAAFLALDALARFVAQWSLEALFRARADVSPLETATAVGAVLAIDLALAVAVSFFGSRFLLRAIVRATPAPHKPPTRAIPWAAACASAIVVVVSVIVFASSAAPSAAAWLWWAFQLTRAAVIVALFRVGALRAVGPIVR